MASLRPSVSSAPPPARDAEVWASRVAIGLMIVAMGGFTLYEAWEWKTSKPPATSASGPRHTQVMAIPVAQPPTEPEAAIDNDGDEHFDDDPQEPVMTPDFEPPQVPAMPEHVRGSPGLLTLGDHAASDSHRLPFGSVVSGTRLGPPTSEFAPPEPPAPEEVPLMPVPQEPIQEPTAPEPSVDEPTPEQPPVAEQPETTSDDTETEHAESSDDDESESEEAPEE